MSKVTYEDICKNPEIRTYIQKADEALIALGFTEHSFAHVTSCANKAGEILKKLGYSEREQELVQIAGYMHDIGNLVNRIDHAQSGAIMAFRILDHMGMPADEIAAIVSAIGNHDEGTAYPVNAIAAALILADKTDVRRSRVRNSDMATFDIHDRVNYAVTSSVTYFSPDMTEYILEIKLDTEVASVMSYFEIFLTRMLLCRKAAEFFGKTFSLIVNDQKLL